MPRKLIHGHHPLLSGISGKLPGKFDRKSGKVPGISDGKSGIFLDFPDILGFPNFPDNPDILGFLDNFSNIPGFSDISDILGFPNFPDILDFLDIPVFPDFVDNFPDIPDNLNLDGDGGQESGSCQGSPCMIRQSVVLTLLMRAQ